jgi:MFS family permease
LLVLFAVRERRVVARGDEPLLDLRLLTETPGYASGAALGTVYFVGFSGIWLVFATYFQTGLGYTPLQSGLVVTSFALGAAASAAVGGRLVARLGRQLTVLGLALVAVGLAATALVLLLAPTSWTGPAVVVTLLVAGIGGGWVISPNTTMTLRCVPVRMAGSAGGALQTGQRIGSAIGTAALAAVYYGVLGGSGGQASSAVAVAVGAAALTVLLALGIAVGELRASRPPADPDAEDGPAPDGGFREC